VTDTRAGSPSATAEKPFEITFPRGREEDRDQDEEFCEVALHGETRRIRFHDYHELYAIPGLYEQLFYEKLKCDSPHTIATLLDEQLDDDAAADLRVLDVGAGNGMVGEELDRMGAEHIVGVDIIEEAAEAAQRDRPGVYDDYFVVDLTDVLWGPMAEPLRDPGYFRRVQVDPELRTIVWPNGFDLDPDVLHGNYEPAPSPDSIARQAPN